MADIEAEGGKGTRLLPEAHRVVRTLDDREGPFVGALVTAGDGVAVRVEAAVLGGWVGWRYAGAEHVAAPIDLIRRGGGHDVLLPWCTDRVLGFLVRRTAAGSVLSPGECSTLVISLLRGLHEVEGGPVRTRSGVWWLTDGGRPVFVFGEGSDVRAGVGEILERLSEHSADKVLKRALGMIAQGMDRTAAQPSIPGRLLETWEQELLNVAAPQPLDRAKHAPERARDVARVAPRDLTPMRSGPGLRPAERLRSGQRLRADRSRGGVRRGIVPRVEALRDAARASAAKLVARVADARGGTFPRRQEKADAATSADTPRRKRRLMIVAGAAAAVVLGAGLLWPDGGAPVEAGDGGGTAAAQERSAGRATESPSTAGVTNATEAVDGSEDGSSGGPEDSNGADASTDDDPVAAASALLQTIADCRAQADPTCPDGVASGVVGVVDALEPAMPEESSIELVDEYGDVAVVRVTVNRPDGDDAAGASALMVVLIRTQEKWLVRDVYDVADQPD
ncbi:hypothetical protein ACI2IP_14970 [Microbacterium sp. NPDC090218]